MEHAWSMEEIRSPAFMQRMSTAIVSWLMSIFSVRVLNLSLLLALEYAAMARYAESTLSVPEQCLYGMFSIKNWAASYLNGSGSSLK